MVSKTSLFEGTDGMRRMMEIFDLSEGSDIEQDLHSWAGETSIGDLQRDMSDVEILHQIRTMGDEGHPQAQLLDRYPDRDIIGVLGDMRDSLDEIAPAVAAGARGAAVAGSALGKGLAAAARGALAATSKKDKEEEMSEDMRRLLDIFDDKGNGEGDVEKWAMDFDSIHDLQRQYKDIDLLNLIRSMAKDGDPLSRALEKYDDETLYQILLDLRSQMEGAEPRLDEAHDDAKQLLAKWASRAKREI